MDLPFAVDSSPERGRTSLHNSNASSLVTASSQGSILPSGSDQSSVFDPASNTILASQQVASPGVSDDDEIVDFMYVNVYETDEVDVVMDGRDPSPEEENVRGDVLAVLLSGGTQEQDGESIVVSFSFQDEKASSCGLTVAFANVLWSFVLSTV